MLSYSTCHLKYLHNVDIRASDISIGASYRQVFIWVNYIYIGPYHTNIGAQQVQVFVGVNNINIGSYDINIGACYIDIGASQVVFGPYNHTLLIDLALLPERYG